MKRVLFQRSDRVKGVDLHPTEPWLLANLYNGSVHIWNYVDQTLVKSFEVTDLPVRASKFIARKQWIVAGSDDMMVRVFNYNTTDKVGLGSPAYLGVWTCSPPSHPPSLTRLPPLLFFVFVTPRPDSTGQGLRGALGLHQVRGRAPHAALPAHEQR